MKVGTIKATWLTRKTMRRLTNTSSLIFANMMSLTTFAARLTKRLDVPNGTSSLSMERSAQK